MKRRTAAWLAWSMGSLSLLFVAFSSGVLVFLSVSSRIYSGLGMTALFALLPLTFTTVGAVVASRRPENPIGWIFCVGGLVLSVAVSATNYAEYALEANTGSLPGVQYSAWIASWAPIPTLLLTATMLFLLFPDGKLSSRDWGFVAWVAVIASAMVVLGDALGRDNVGTDLGSIANPVVVGGTVGNIVDVLGGFGFVLLTLCFVASVAAPFARLNQARGQERQQIKWFAYAAAVMIGGLVVILLLGTDRSALSELMWDLGWLVGILGFAFLPVATAIAILRYRLYNIDIIINRTLVYVPLTLMLALVYFGGVTVTQSLFQTLTSQEKLPQLIVVASTLLIAALFNPLRRRFQSFIDRRFYRRKYDARKTLEVFSAKLRNETDLEALNNDLVGVVRETMQPAHVSLWLRPDTVPKGEQAD
jgi:hypothetical protein